MIIHFTECYPKNAIVSDFFVVISIRILFTMSCNVNTPLCKLSSELAIVTCSSAKRRYICNS